MSLFNKFYNKKAFNKSENKSPKGSLQLNERILTPESIPVFVLPPTVETLRKLYKPSSISSIPSRSKNNKS